jgi:hypothetical protein
MKSSKTFPINKWKCLFSSCCLDTFLFGEVRSWYDEECPVCKPHSSPCHSWHQQATFSIGELSHWWDSIMTRLWLKASFFHILRYHKCWIRNTLCKWLIMSFIYYIHTCVWEYILAIYLNNDNIWVNIISGALPQVTKLVSCHWQESLQCF